MLALLYDIHGNLPALEAVLDDARRAGADRWLIGGDAVAFGGRPVDVLDRLQGLDATWIRGNTERWLADRSDLPADQPMHEAALACRTALGDGRADDLAALPESAALDAPGGGVAWHASPVSDMRSFGPEGAGDEDELLDGVTVTRLAFGHTHLQFVRTHPSGVELLNPGSIGMPLDGDRRAAYALIDDDGRIVLRRVDYDWERARHELLDAAAGAQWGDIVAGRLDRAAG